MTHEYYLKNKKKILAKNKKWWLANKKKHALTCQRHRQKSRSELFGLLGDLCMSCGNGDIRVLQIDHIKGGGSQERKKLQGLPFYNYAKTHLKKYQILCANCNWIKRSENKETARKHL